MKKSGLFALAAVMMMSGAAYAGPLADATADTLWGIEIGGYLDVGYTYNINNPDKAVGNGVRQLNADHNEFDLNALQLYFDKLPENAGEAGFRLDFMYGENANILSLPGDIFSGDDFVLYQAYISYIADIGNGLTIDLGRFSTPLGYEAIESPARDQYSRSLGDNMVPWTHTGLRLTYPINDQWEVMGAVVNGADVVEDNNDAQSFLAAIRWMPMETVYIANTISYGPEMNLNESDYTFLYDLVATWNVAEDWTLGVNFDWSTTEDAAIGGDDADTWGVSAYARYDVDENWYLAARLGWMNDDDGAVFGMIDNELWEVTLTAGYTWVEGLETRLEYRHDDTDALMFDDDGKADDSQDTISVQVLYCF